MGTNGLKTMVSEFGFTETIARLERAIKVAGMRVFARIEHSAAASAVNMTLRPTELLIFGNPEGGTPLMQARQSIGIDLPLKALVYEDSSSQVLVAYNDPTWLAERHGLNVTAANVVTAMTNALGHITAQATGSPAVATDTAWQESTDALAAARIAVAMDYFRRVDAADPGLMDLMTEDVQLYFPKFGVGHGKAAVAESARGFHASLREINHDVESMNIMISGDHVIVEGFEHGVTAAGDAWPDPDRSEGRYCNVFEFRELLIKRVHVYVDPDFTSADRARFLWGDKVRRTRLDPSA